MTRSETNVLINNSVAIIATRPESKRLPGKAFRKVAGLPAIEHILRRLAMKTILAIPTGCKDYDYLKNKYPDVIIESGNPESPLHRIADIVKKRKEKWIVRITHDDILIDQATIISLLKACEDQDAGYGCTPTIVEGAGVEVIRRENILNAAEAKKEPTEYLSYFVKSKPITIKPRQTIERDYRLTMDYYEDWLVLDTVLSKVGKYALLDKVVNYLDVNPYILQWNKLPDISVYTCAYNAEKWISDTIHSVTQQNHPNFEYIIIDDASTDKTAIKIMSFPSKDIRYYRNEKNMGLASSSNQALSLAKGKYVIRVDADDMLYSGALNLMQTKLSGSNAGILYPAYNEIDKNSVITKLNHPPKMYHHAGCALMDKRLINEIRFTNSLRYWDSLDLFQKLKEKNSDIEYCDSPLWAYRKHDNSMSSVMTEDREKTLKEVQNGKPKN